MYEKFFFEKLNFDCESVFLKKYINIDKIKNLFVMIVLKINIFINSNISDHFGSKFQRKIINILKNYQTLF